jgi:hypothetical protein
METKTATRTDRALSAAHGTVPAFRTGTVALAAKRINGVAPMAAFGVPSTYVADQESHPPREHPVA